MITGVYLPYFGVDLVYSRDHSNAFGVDTEFVLELSEEVYRQVLEACKEREGKSGTLPRIPYGSSLFENVPDVQWKEAHVNEVYECRISHFGQTDGWLIVLAEPYMIYSNWAN